MEKIDGHCWISAKFICTGLNSIGKMLCEVTISILLLAMKDEHMFGVLQAIEYSSNYQEQYYNQ